MSSQTQAPASISAPRPLARRPAITASMAAQKASPSSAPSLKPSRPSAVVRSPPVSKPLKTIAHHDADYDSDAESFDSDAPAPSSSGVFDVALSDYELQKKFGAIVVPINQLKETSKANEFDKFRGVANVFLNCYATILHCLEDLPPDVRAASGYDAGYLSIDFLRSLFVSHLVELATGIKDKKSTARMVLQVSDMMMGSLKGLLIMAEKQLLLSKPLPPAPIPSGEADDESSDEEEAATLASGCAAATTENADSAGKKPADDGGAEASTGNVGRTKRLLKTLNKLRSGKKRSGSVSSTEEKEPAPYALMSGSSATLVEGGVSVAIAGHSTHNAEVRNIRASLMLIPEPAAPELVVCKAKEDTELGDVVYGNYVDPMKRVRKVLDATPRKLVSILTSMDTVINHEFVTMFFVSFRLFMTPQTFFELLTDLYDQPRPGHVKADEWQGYSIGQRVRIAKVLKLWIDLYWRDAEDGSLFEPVLDFVAGRMAQDTCGPVTGEIFRKLFERSQNTTDNRKRLQTRLAAFQPGVVVTAHPRTEFLFPTAHAAGLVHYFPTLHDFDASPYGAQELARQLTLRASALYRDIDPEVLVMQWVQEMRVKGAPKASPRLNAHRKALNLWATEKIMSETTRPKRAIIIGFFLRVAKHCLELNDFFTSNSLWVAVTSSVVHRMAETMHEITLREKAILNKLDHLYNTRGNLIQYRTAFRAASRPAVPLLDIFSKDITSAVSEGGMVIRHAKSPDDMIKFSAYRAMMNTLTDMDHCHVPYKIEPYPEVLQWLDNQLLPLTKVSERQCENLTQQWFELSKQYEPFGRAWAAPETVMSSLRGKGKLWLERKITSNSPDFDVTGANAEKASLPTVVEGKAPGTPF